MYKKNEMRRWKSKQQLNVVCISGYTNEKILNNYKEEKDKCFINLIN